MHALQKDRVMRICIGIVIFYSLIALFAAVGWIATPWDAPVGKGFDPPSLDKFSMWFGTDIFGRSVLYKMIHGARLALSVGLVSTLMSIPIGVALGAAAGYFGGLVDEFVTWFYTTISSIPNILLLIAITYSLGRGLTAVYVALGATSWVGLARVVRGEFLKHREREYVLAAAAIGAGHSRRIFRHILPNISHLILVQFSISFVSAIKSEVILSFLGLGVQGQPSWGVMIDEAKQELSRLPVVWWQLVGASLAMTGIILAFNLLGDSLRDAIDPKAAGSAR